MKVPIEKPGTPEELMLKHHGVKGQRWGVRKEEDKTGSERIKKDESLSERKKKRIQEHRAEAGAAQVEIDRIKANPSKIFFVQYHRNQQIKELEKYRDHHLKAAKDISEGHLTDTQKKALIAGGVVIGVLAAYGTYKLIDSGKAHQLLTRTPLKKNDLLTREWSPEAMSKVVVKPINPGYGGVGTKMNCRRCTFAYEMRRRGFDVKATNSVAGTGQSIAGMMDATNPNINFKAGRVSMLSQYVKELEAEKHGAQPGPVTHFLTTGAKSLGRQSIGDENFRDLTPKAKTLQIFQGLAKHPDGARGEIAMAWSGGGAHSMAWEIIGGKPTIFDAQTGRRYTEEVFERDEARRIARAGITRLDNVELDYDFLLKWVRNVG